MCDLCLINTCMPTAPSAENKYELQIEENQELQLS
jgi:hypothetical protein